MTIERLKKERADLLLTRMATRAGNKKAIEFLKKFNPDTWMVWGKEDKPGTEAFPVNSIITVGWDDEPGPGGTNVGLGWNKFI